MPKVRQFGTKRSRLCDEIKGQIAHGMVASHIKTQAELSKKTGIKPTTLSLHLREIERMPLGELLSICDKTGLHLSIRGNEDEQL